MLEIPFRIIFLALQGTLLLVPANATRQRIIIRQRINLRQGENVVYARNYSEDHAR